MLVDWGVELWKSIVSQQNGNLTSVAPSVTVTNLSGSTNKIFRIKGYLHQATSNGSGGLFLQANGYSAGTDYNYQYISAKGVTTTAAGAQTSNINLSPMAATSVAYRFDFDLTIKNGNAASGGYPTLMGKVYMRNEANADMTIIEVMGTINHVADITSILIGISPGLQTGSYSFDVLTPLNPTTGAV